MQLPTVLDSCPPATTRRLVHGKAYELPWDGRPFTPGILTFDTETTVVEDNRSIPRFVLATVTNGGRTAVITPDQLSWFVRCHDQHTWVGHNVAFDYWVVRDQLDRDRETHALEVWDWTLTDGRFHDTMLLDFLVRLADVNDGGVLRMLDLATLARNRLGYARTNKQDDHRKRFAELIGREADWPNPVKADQAFFDYAVADTLDTHAVYRVLAPKAQALSVSSASAVDKYGWLTEELQVRSSVVLAQIGRNGMAVDRGRLETARTRLEGEVDVEVGWLLRRYPDLFELYKTKEKKGQFKVNQGTGVPHLKVNALRDHLIAEAAAEGIEAGSLLTTDKTDAVSTSLDYWRDTLRDSELVSHWSRLMDLAKTLQFVVKLDDGGDGPVSVHPEYRVLVRTGRTSCTKPNIQQMPREAWFRSMFVARPGHRLVIADYSAIEITTLAAVMIQRFGPDHTLARVLREGRDPHAYTAALVLGRSYEEVQAGLKEDKRRIAEATANAGSPWPETPFVAARQAAKAINFGVPGGLGARRLAGYARHSYGVEMSVEEASRLRGLLINTVYPELANYLADDLPARLAAVLRVTPEAVISEFNPRHPGFWRNVGLVLGQKTGKKAKKVGSGVKNLIWGTLARLNRNPAIQADLEAWRGGERLRRLLTGETVVTLPGRVRAGADYGEARNTPFQGLAADGAKVALWELHRRGFKIVAFVHDEIVTEMPDTGDVWAEDRLVQQQVQIMKDSMQSVLDCDLPVGVEVHVADCWSK